MRVLVIGAGAIGGWLAGVLARGGAEVSVLARGQTLRAIRNDKLIVLDREHRKEYSLVASSNADELPRPDVVVLAVKTNGFAEAVAGAGRSFAHRPLVVTAMNGLPWWFLMDLAGPLRDQRLESIDPGGRASEMLNGVQPVAGVVHASTKAEAPGVIRVAAVDRLILGQPDGKSSPALTELARIVTAGGVACPVSPIIRTEIWAKLWGNMSMNPVSALTRRTTNAIQGDTHLLALLRDMMTEFVRVGARVGITLPMTVEDRLALARKLGDFRTSMLNDIEADRPLEVEGLLGVVVEMADKLGEPVPASRAVYALARAINPGTHI